MEPVGKASVQIPQEENAKKTESKEWANIVMSLFGEMSKPFDVSKEDFNGKINDLYEAYRISLNSCHEQFSEKLEITSDKVEELYAKLKTRKDNLIDVAVSSPVFQDMIPKKSAGEMYTYFHDKITPLMLKPFGDVSITEKGKEWLTWATLSVLPKEKQEKMKQQFSALPDDLNMALIDERREIGKFMLENFKKDDGEEIISVLENKEVFEVAGRYWNLLQRAKTDDEDYSEVYRQNLLESLPLMIPKLPS